jgi:hypothetical protein
VGGLRWGIVLVEPAGIKGAFGVPAGSSTFDTHHLDQGKTQLRESRQTCEPGAGDAEAGRVEGKGRRLDSTRTGWSVRGPGNQVEGPNGRRPLNLVDLRLSGANRASQEAASLPVLGFTPSSSRGLSTTRRAENTRRAGHARGGGNPGGGKAANGVPSPPAYRRT